MRRLIATALCSGAALALAQSASAPAPAPSGASAPVSPAKQALVQKLLKVQQPGIEGMALNLVEQPAVQLSRAAGQALQQVPPEKRDAVGKTIDAEIHKFIDDSSALVKERAVKLAPSTIGVLLEEKFTEDELKQLIAWFDSPVSRKFSQLGPEIQNSFSQKLLADVRPTLAPQLQALETKVRADLGLAAPGASASAVSGPTKASPPAKKASAK